jgi:hypothetical protein
MHLSPISNILLTSEWRKALYTNGVVVGETKHVGYVNEDKKELLHSWLSGNAGIVIKVKFQTSFRHSRLYFFKELQTKKSWGIKYIFISKNPFEI